METWLQLLKYGKFPSVLKIQFVFNNVYEHCQLEILYVSSAHCHGAVTHSTAPIVMCLFLHQVLISSTSTYIAPLSRFRICLLLSSPGEEYHLM